MATLAYLYVTRAPGPLNPWRYSRFCSPEAQGPGKEKAPTLTVKGPFPRSRLQMRFPGEALQLSSRAVLGPGKRRDGHRTPGAFAHDAPVLFRSFSTSLHAVVDHDGNHADGDGDGRRPAGITQTREIQSSMMAQIVRAVSPATFSAVVHTDGGWGIKTRPSR